MALIFITSITTDGKSCGPDAIRAGIAAMGTRFTNLDVAAALGRAGFEPDDLWIRQEIALRLLQKIKRAGLATWNGKFWTAPVPILDAVLQIEGKT